MSVSTAAQQTVLEPSPEPPSKEPTSMLQKRLSADQNLLDNRFSITQFKRNYFLPFTYITEPNPLGNEDLTSDNIDNKEAKFQLSVKLPLYNPEETLEGLYFGFTLTSFWQLYNSEVSKPFRETNYEPEVFYQWSTDLALFGIDFNTLQLGFNHMSNGQSGESSRSWNRIVLSSLFSDADNVYFIRTWYRIPEDTKATIDDPTGDDNPNIESYYGRLELGYSTRYNNFQFYLVTRNNLSFNDNRGSVEFSVSYPLSERYEVMVQYFNGYGDSLIDYNNRETRIGMGVQLSVF